MKKKGMMLSETAFVNYPILIKNAGFDFFIIDCEHGGFDYKDVAQLIMNARFANVECVIRLADNSRKDITKYMDMGADGLLLPMTNCAEDIAQVVRYAKYSPVGQRGVSTMRAHTRYAPPPILQYVQEANAHTKIYAQIETQKGLENIVAVLSVKGVDGCFFGPNDYSVDCGCIGKSDSEEILAAMSRLAQAARAAEKSCGIITSNAVLLRHAKQERFTHFCVGSELSMFARAAKETVEQINSEF